MSNTTVLDEKWNIQILKLQDFIQTFGVENITKSKAPNEVFNFFRHRKADFREGKLSNEKILDLKRIGVVFSIEGYNKEDAKKYSSKSNEQIIGKKFNRLMVLEKTNTSSAGGSLLYLGKCDCGEKTLATKYSLKSGKKATCGGCHYSKRKYILEDYIGKTFGMLTIINKSEIKKKSKTYWTAKCDCRNITEVSTANLFSPNNLVNVHNCGCLNLKHNKNEVIKKAVDSQRKLREKGLFDDSIINASMKIKKSNNSGFIGVYIIKESVTKKGAINKSFCEAKISFRKIHTVIGRYEDSKEGLLQGAIDRDIYIIEHKLPHTRNFTDDELLVKIKKRTDGELEGLQELLKIKYEQNKK